MSNDISAPTAWADRRACGDELRDFILVQTAAREDLDVLKTCVVEDAASRAGELAQVARIKTDRASAEGRAAFVCEPHHLVHPASVCR